MIGVRQSAVIPTGFDRAKRVIATLILVLPGGVGLIGCGNVARPPQILQVGCDPSRDDLKPAEFTSPSKAFRLERIPHYERYEIRDVSLPLLKGARYRMLHNGEETWVMERDYALEHPLVTDNGTVVGIAYRNEYETEKPPIYRRRHFHMVIIRDGREVVDWTREQEPSQPPATIPPDYRPRARSLTVDCGNDRVIVEAVEPEDTWTGHQVCWLFRLSTGQFLSRIDLPKLYAALGHADAADRDNSFGVFVPVTELRVVAGTSLILLHLELPGRSKTNEGESTRYDSLFVLMDSGGTPVWTLRVAGNITIWNSQNANDGPARDPCHALLVTGKPGCFGVFRTWADCVEEYTVRPHKPEGWQVTKTGRIALTKARRDHGMGGQPAPP